jgi:ectoine hydroxylase-related dioxygenase (phytanoyl-CoA dioxygenase family)
VSREQLAQSLAELGASPDLLSGPEERLLDEQGYLPMPGVLAPSEVVQLAKRFDDLIAAESDNAGLEAHREDGTDRLANLVDKDPIFDLCWNYPRQLAAAAHVLRWQDFKVFALNGRAALPSSGHQGLHVDWHQAVEPGEYEICNSIWLLDDFTEQNGATRVVPGSHRSGRLPKDVMADPRHPHPEEVLLLGTAGTCVIFNSHLWHSGTENRTYRPRRALHSAFVRRDGKQQTVFRDYVRPVTLERLSRAQRYLLDV